VAGEECKGRTGNMAQMYIPICTSIVAEKPKAGKQLKMDDMLKKSQPADPPSTSTKILLSTSMATNINLNAADFFYQFNPLLYHSSHQPYQCIQSSPHTPQ
jgi:hypothetical protein